MGLPFWSYLMILSVIMDLVIYCYFYPNGFLDIRDFKESSLLCGIIGAQTFLVVACFGEMEPHYYFKLFEAIFITKKNRNVKRFIRKHSPRLYEFQKELCYKMFKKPFQSKKFVSKRRESKKYKEFEESFSLLELRLRKVVDFIIQFHAFIIFIWLYILIKNLFKIND